MHIELIKEPTIKVPEIVVPILDKELPNRPENVLGIFAPLISVNGVLVDFHDVISLSIDSTGPVPTISFEVNDYNGSIKKFEDTGKDNYIQIQILPPFDGAYKKVNLKFYISNISVGSTVSGSGMIDIKELYKSQYMHLGQLSTFELAQLISTKTGLGFGSNIAGSADKRYMNCAYKSFKDVMGDEIARSEASQTRVLDWWIDLWNNLILCDIYERYKTIDDNLKIWISEKNDVVDGPVVPIETDLILNNSPATQSTELNILSAEPVNKNYKNLKNAQVLSVYDMNLGGYIDHQVTDEKVDMNIHYEYRGEVYGDYNYLLAGEVRDHYMRNISTETLEVHTRSPLLGINRGDQVRLVWYDNDASTSIKLDDLSNLGVNLEEVKMGWLKDYMEKKEGLNVNLKTSGQYMVLGYAINYIDHEWDYKLILVRVSPKINILPDEQSKL